MAIQIKRAYDAVSTEDGARYLIDRLWPRGKSKADLAIDGWRRDLAVSDALFRGYHHDQAKWPEFREKYLAELAANESTWRPLLDQARTGTVTLVFAAKDTEHSNAAVLKEFLDERLAE
jgi:uncharacterized protein YeaO (DUF488 family)